MQTLASRDDARLNAAPLADLQANDAFLRLRGLTKRYDNGFVAVDNLNLDLPKGKLLGLLGPSGGRENDDAAHDCRSEFRHGRQYSDR